MTQVTGQQYTSTMAQFQRPVDMAKALYKLEPDAAPFTVLLNGIKTSKAAKNSTFSWGNVSPASRFGVTTASANSSVTTIAVDDGTQYGAEWLFSVPRTGELISVTSISTNNLTVERGIGGTTAAPLNSGEQLYILGVAATEGDYSKPARTQLPTQVTNYTEIFKRSVAASGTELSSDDMFDEHEWVRMQKEQGVEHRKDIELQFILGAPGERTSQSSTSSGKRRTTGGVLNYFTSNVQAAGGTLSTATLRTWMQSLFRYGSNERTVFASSKVLAALDSFVEGKLQLRSSDSSFNVSMAQWVFSAGTLNFVKHPLLEGTTLSGYGFAVDWSDNAIAFRYLGGGPGGSRNTKLLENRQANDLDGRQDEYISEVGLQAGKPGVHGVLTGVTGPA